MVSLSSRSSSALTDYSFRNRYESCCNVGKYERCCAILFAGFGIVLVLCQAVELGLLLMFLSPTNGQKACFAVSLTTSVLNLIFQFVCCGCAKPEDTDDLPKTKEQKCVWTLQIISFIAGIVTSNWNTVFIVTNLILQLPQSVFNSTNGRICMKNRRLRGILAKILQKEVLRSHPWCKRRQPR